MDRRTFLGAAVLLAAAREGEGKEPGLRVYVSISGDRRIALYDLDPETGALRPTGQIAVEGAPGAMTTDTRQRVLYVALRGTGALAAFRIDPATGALSALSSVAVGADPTFLQVSPTGRSLLSAYYAAGKVMVHGLGEDGRIAGEARQTIPTALNAHSAVFDPGGRFVFVPHTGPNAIFQFRWDAAAGTLAPNDPPRLQTPEHTGPRHIRFHPTLPVAYTANEDGSSVTAYRFDAASGTLSPLQTLSTLPADFTGKNTCAEIRVHPTGRFVYVSNRGHDSLAAFTVDAATGKLTASGHARTEKTPRSFALDPSGRLALAAGQESTKLTAYRIDAGSGKMSPLETYEVGPNPFWIQILPRL